MEQVELCSNHGDGRFCFQQRSKSDDLLGHFDEGSLRSQHSELHSEDEMVEDLGRSIGVGHGSWKRGQGAEVAHLLHVDEKKSVQSGIQLDLSAVRPNLEALKAHAGYL